MAIRDPVKRKEYMKLYHKQWYDKPENRTRRIQQAKARAKPIKARNKNFILEYKLLHPCEICKEPRPQCLDLHHTGDKKQNISSMAGGGWSTEAIMLEISKCKVLCKNCHADLHHQEKLNETYLKKKN